MITRDEEELIAQCLASACFCDELIVVDSFSTDRTVEIATGLGARVFTQEFTDYVRQKQIALDHATCEWVLLLDADEQVTHDLGREIDSTLSARQVRPTATAFGACSTTSAITTRDRFTTTVRCGSSGANAAISAASIRMTKSIVNGRVERLNSSRFCISVIATSPTTSRRSTASATPQRRRDGAVTRSPRCKMFTRSGMAVFQFLHPARRLHATAGAAFTPR